MNRYLIYIIPVFLFFILFEMIVDAVTHKKTYRFEDTITNISLGLGQQVIEALAKTAFAVLFLWVYKYALFKLRDTIWIFLAVVLVSDFLYYWFHRLSHTTNVLWAIHIVHHQSSEFNLTVSLRQPWLHKLAAFGFFLVLPLLGVSPTIMILAFAFQTSYQFWLHTRFVGRLGRLEKILVTPSHHRVHHGTNDIYLDKNYGNTFIIWDKLFGTFRAETEPVTFGTTRPFTSTNPIWANIDAWKELVAGARSRKGFSSKVKAFFQKPAVNICHTPAPAEEVSPGSAVSGRLAWYIAVQCILTSGLATFYLLKQDAFPLSLKIGCAIFIIWSLYSFSALMQHKKHATTWELVRSIVLCLLTGLVPVLTAIT